MKIEDALKSSDITRLDAEILLGHILDVNRAWLSAHSLDEMRPEDLRTFQDFVNRRKKNEPVAYIIGSKEFYGRSFIVDSSVLIPRPATEKLIDEAKYFLETGHERIVEADSGIIIFSLHMKRSPQNVSTIVDIGTGSGCIIITLALELDGYTFIGSDCSAKALMVAEKNVTAHEVNNVEFREGNMLESIQDIHEPFLLVSNPPYIPSNEQLMDDVLNYEPHVALFGGNDGADFVRTILLETQKHPFCQGVVLECRTEHGSLLEEFSP